ncbi:MAG: hypothetical protein HKO90_07720 [Flavobacteriaceae bacterium]|nr:hypothetical protein [Flavobacteriaceae bacterium]
MKRLLTLGLVITAFFLGSTTMNAQEKYKVMDEKIKVEAYELQKTLNLDDEQTALLARSIYAKEKSLSEIQVNDKLSAADVAKIKSKIEMNFKSRLMDILSEEQFEAFSAYQAKKKPKY